MVPYKNLPRHEEFWKKLQRDDPVQYLKQCKQHLRKEMNITRDLREDEVFLPGQHNDEVNQIFKLKVSQKTNVDNDTTTSYWYGTPKN